ncbi:hypothetical protein GCM10012287_34610 [Streptomyces daqingensis]|uniref:ABC transporter permease n=1 Tax=Streptomyces daqingensis TaxID=1472640 RepID=A0ABQ2MHC0_9ACTN|nr:hypothetical protein [Streptomyces daqingensis]GGO51782.1 hypothetical protein GCM10012287_34610 [Streptomyces daqingensis]
MTTARARDDSPRSVTAARRQAPPSGGDGRELLPWWAAVLPVLAFALLLSLLIGGGDANAAAPQPWADVLAVVLERFEQALLG